MSRSRISLVVWCAAFCAAGSESDSQLFTLKCKFLLVFYDEWKVYMIWLWHSSPNSYQH